MTACKDFDVLLSLHAAGALDRGEAARLEAHLATCAACRAEAAADAEVLRLAKLPPPSDAERRATASLTRDALAALHRREGRAFSWKRTGAAVLAAAAVFVAVLTPAILGKRVSPPGMVDDAGGAAVASAAWQEPDLDTLWSDAGLFEDDSAASSSTTDAATDAALVAFDL